MQQQNLYKTKIILVGLISLWGVLLIINTSIATEIVATGRSSGGAILGKGYSTKSQDFSGDCLISTRENLLRVGAPEATIVFTRSLSSSELQKSLGFAVATRARFGLTQVSAGADFAREATSNEYSETTTYIATYWFKNAYVFQPPLSKFAQELRGSDQFVSQNFLKACGDEYVEQIRLGAKLLINARIEFANQAEKERFAAEVNVKGPAFALSANLQQASARFGSSAAVTISAYQLGGKVDRLSKIFSRGKVTGSSEGSHALLMCSLSRIQPCLDVLSTALDYATSSTDTEAFPQQIKSQYNPFDDGGAADLVYITKPWSTIGLFARPDQLEQFIEDARSQLGMRYEKQVKYRNRLDSLGNTMFRLSPSQVTILNSYREMIDANLQDLWDASIVCYMYGEQCPSKKESVFKVMDDRNKTYEFNVNRLNIIPETFAQWCDHVGYESATPRPALAATRRTVEALIQYVRRIMVRGDDSEYWKSIDDKCKFAEDILNESLVIALSDHAIGDLRPLTAFANLESLILAGAEIDNTILNRSGLPALKNLRQLDLSRNAISDLAEISRLTTLQVLILADNHIYDTSQLSMLKQLRVLDLSNNPIENKTCPIINIDGTCFF